MPLPLAVAEKIIAPGYYSEKYGSLCLFEYVTISSYAYKNTNAKCNYSMRPLFAVYCTVG